MELLAYFVIKTIYILKLYMIENTFFSLEIRRKKYIWVFPVLLVMLGAVIEVVAVKMNTAFLFPFIIGPLCMIALFEGKVWKKVKSYILSFFFVEAVDLLVYSTIGTICNKSIEDMSNFNHKGIDIVCLIPGLIIWFVIYIVMRRKRIDLGKWVGYYIFLLLTMIFICWQMAAASIFLTYDRTQLSYDNNRWIFLIIIISSISSVALSILYVSKLTEMRAMQLREIDEIRKKDDQIQKYYLQLYEGNESARAFQHDIRHWAKLLNELIEEDEKEKSLEIVGYLLSAGKEKSKKIVYSQNIIIDSTIHGIIGKEIEEGAIDFKYTGVLPRHLDISDIDLCALVSNILENARNAALKLKENRVITMSSHLQENVLSFRVINVYDGNRNISISKHNGHGYGMDNIRRIVKKYHGEVSFETNNNEFCVFVTMLTEK